jgi:hypothetical protein
MIQPMMTAIRTNNLADMMNYEDIMINLDEVMLNNKRGTEITGRIQEAFREHQIPFSINGKTRLKTYVLK